MFSMTCCVGPKQRRRHASNQLIAPTPTPLFSRELLEEHNEQGDDDETVARAAVAADAESAAAAAAAEEAELEAKRKIAMAELERLNKKATVSEKAKFRDKAKFLLFFLLNGSRTSYEYGSLSSLRSLPRLLPSLEEEEEEEQEEEGQEGQRRTLKTAPEDLVWF
jgi:hypothetical protein